MRRCSLCHQDIRNDQFSEHEKECQEVDKMMEEWAREECLWKQRRAFDEFVQSGYQRLKKPYFDNKFKCFMLYHIFFHLLDQFVLLILFTKLIAVQKGLYYRGYSITFQIFIVTYYV